MNPRRILLTGASGTLGRNFLELAGNDPNFEILALLRPESRFCQNYSSVKEVREDLWNRERVARIVAEFRPSSIVLLQGWIFQGLSGSTSSDSTWTSP